MNLDAPYSKEDLIAAFQSQESENDAYWKAFDTAAFFRPFGSSWSPADTVRHLTKSIRPVAQALRVPKIVLRFKFGASRRPSVTYDELRTRYQKALAEGGQAGRFAPSAAAEADAGAWRSSILGEFERVQDRLRLAIGRWTDEKLDRIQLPHPLLGDLTVREMLFFTLYHERHHIGVIDRRVRA